MTEEEKKIHDPSPSQAGGEVGGTEGEGLVKVEKSGQQASRCTSKRWAMIVGGIVIALIGIALLIYFLLAGTGDEAHTAGVAKSANCKAGSDSTTSIRVMTFNSFLIRCTPKITCQTEDKREERVKRISEWFSTRTEDVVLVQEVWSFHNDLKQGMADAGFCNYVMSNSKRGSGLAIFSKFPIDTHDFMDWYDAFGIGEGMRPGLNPESVLLDKGILYAKIKKDEDTSFSVFNLHTSSDTAKDAHEDRLKQYNVIRNYVQDKDIPSTDMVLLGGDFNEDKFCSEYACEGFGPYCEDETYYKEMVDILETDTPALMSNQTFTYDTTMNTILLEKGQQDEDFCFYRLLLDYVFYSKTHLIPGESSNCGIVFARDPSGGDLSDHFPIACEFNY